MGRSRLLRTLAGGWSQASRRRIWRLYHVLFALLVIHFLAVYLAPSYMMIDQRGAIGVLTGGADARPGDRRGQARVIERDGRTLLWGGDRQSMHFDISRFELDPDRLRYGLGREAFPALIEPEFVSLKNADHWLHEESRVLLVQRDDEVKVYPIDLLVRHEVVNDTIAGEPIFAAYCILADLGAVYSRRFREHTLTFALSGYTYAEPDVWDGMDAFVLWDRETESLWWPPSGRAVSGPLIGEPLPLFDQRHWSQTTWEKVKAEHPGARVLDRGQDMERPTDWPTLNLASAAATNGDQAEAQTQTPSVRIAPRWGENSVLAASKALTEPAESTESTGANGANEPAAAAPEPAPADR